MGRRPSSREEARAREGGLAVMSYIDVLALQVDQPTAKFTDEIKFDIIFHCKMKPAEDLVWKIVWVSSAKDEKLDQVLDEVDVPSDVGINKFEFAVDPPKVSTIPAADVAGITVVMVQAWYKGKEFIRVGYYVKVQYADQALRDQEPELPEGARPDVNLLERIILVAEPRVTRYLIEWDDAITPAASAIPEGPSSPTGFSKEMIQGERAVEAVAAVTAAEYFQIIDSGADDSCKTHVLSALLANEKRELVEQCFYENHWDGRQFTGIPDWKALREALTKRTQQ